MASPDPDGISDTEFSRKLLRRSLHTIACRELGPTAARHAHGELADTTTEPITLLLDTDALSAHLTGDKELQALLRAVQARGPAVGVTLAHPVS
jgi:hypothetical protein